ncbi:peptidase inhibitor family I36 protein [Streptomyces sp. NBC_00690]|uniref:peptidase inhibitor family I36 protein n=1 Tax=Streptomyces sp. NBC_00690 TaxID=2975808 RepID=UPI002E2D263F|nr:peptidase inhibitor family I36 protein [Streptomyces sp. NBC_00690]
MSWKKQAATLASAFILAGAGILVSGPPAAAASNCPSNSLCFYDSINFGGDRIATGSLYACRYMTDFSSFGHVRSYDNNLNVDGMLWRWDGNGDYEEYRGFPAGGSSSNLGSGIYGAGQMDQFCTGGRAATN